MQKSKDRLELENYIGISRELEAKYARGDIDYLNYRIKQNHQVEVLASRSYPAYVAHRRAVGECFSPKCLNTEQRMAYDELSRQDWRAANEWGEEFRRRNYERLVYLALDFLEAAEVPPIPAPAPKEPDTVPPLGPDAISMDVAINFPPNARLLASKDPVPEQSTEWVAPED